MITQLKTTQDAFRKNFPYDGISNTLVYGVPKIGKSVVLERIVDRLLENRDNRIIHYSNNVTRFDILSNLEVERLADDVLYKAAGASNGRLTDLVRNMSATMVHDGNTVYAVIDSFENIQHVTAIGAFRDIMHERFDTKVRCIVTSMSHPFKEQDVLNPDFKPQIINPTLNGVLHRAWDKFDQTIACLPDNKIVITTKQNT